MGWRDVRAEELMERTEANSHKQGAHQMEDSIEDSIKFVKQIMKIQNWAMESYES